MNPESFRRVVLESPYAGDIPANVAYAKRCIADCLARGEAPIASHLLYPGTLDDSVPEQREWGIAAGHSWIPCCYGLVVYTDLGVSRGMQQGIDVANKHKIPVFYRKLEARQES